ncbi:hypothetical protein B0T20DRAFT_342311, partial [Sordaria brevicollis]
CRDDGREQMSGWDELEKCSAKETVSSTERGQCLLINHITGACWVLSWAPSSYLIIC